jgi:hypothetical protein
MQVHNTIHASAVFVVDDPVVHARHHWNNASNRSIRRRDGGARHHPRGGTGDNKVCYSTRECARNLLVFIIEE